MYYSTIYGPRMVGAGDWQDALRESKRNKPGLSQPERFMDARIILQRLKEGKEEIVSPNEEEEEIVSSDEEEDPYPINQEIANRRRQERIEKNIYNLLDEDEDPENLSVLYAEPEDIQNPELGEILSGEPRRYNAPELPYFQKELKRKIPEPPPFEDIPQAPLLEEVKVVEIPTEYIPTIKEVEEAERKYKLCKFNTLYKNCKEGKLIQTQQFGQMPFISQQATSIPIIRAQPESGPPIVRQLIEEKPQKLEPVDIKISEGKAIPLSQIASNVALEAQKRKERASQGLPPIKREVKQLTPEEIQARLASKGKGLYGGEYIIREDRSHLLSYDDYNPELFQKMLMMAQIAHSNN